MRLKSLDSVKVRWPTALIEGKLKMELAVIITIMVCAFWVGFLLGVWFRKEWNAKDKK
jgi:hypothetical protein